MATRERTMITLDADNLEFLRRQASTPAGIGLYLDKLLTKERDTERREQKMMELVHKGLRASVAYALLAQDPNVNPHVVERLNDLIEFGSVTITGDTITVNVPSRGRE